MNTDEASKGPSNGMGERGFEVVAFSLEGRQFAVPLSSAIRAERIVAITPLPGAPDIIMGIVNVHGRVVPVADVRSRFLIAARPPELNDHLLIIKTARRTIAFIVDYVNGVLDIPEQRFTRAETVLPGMEYVKGVIRLEDGMILIHDPDTFLLAEEESRLEGIIKEGQLE